MVNINGKLIRSGKKSFVMNNPYIKIINYLDECPAYNNILDTKVKYKNGGVNKGN